MTPNFEHWIKDDKTLSALLVEIQSTGNTPLQQAEIAFDKLCALYDLPKTPEDLERFEAYYERRKVSNPRSVYEEAALLRFLEPDDDPRGIVLLAVFHVRNNIGVDIQDVFIRQFGTVPSKPRLGIKGEGVNTTLIFIGDDDSWFDLGCKVMMQLV